MVLLVLDSSAWSHILSRWCCSKQGLLTSNDVIHSNSLALRPNYDWSLAIYREEQASHYPCSKHTYSLVCFSVYFVILCESDQHFHICEGMQYFGHVYSPDTFTACGYKQCYVSQNLDREGFLLLFKRHVFILATCIS